MLDSGTGFLAVLFIVLAVVTNFGLSLWGLSPVYKFHSLLMLLVRFVLPFVAVLILFLCPKSRVRRLSLVLLVPCAAIGLLCAGLLWMVTWMGETEPWKNQDDALAEMGQEVGYCKGDTFNGLVEESRGIHYESRHRNDCTYAFYSEYGWTEEEGETYTLVQYRNVGPFFRKKVREIELPVNHWPRFVSPGKDKLSIELHREQDLLLTADVDDILSGRVKLGH